MSTIIFPSPIFGPVRSRRLGISLGINLMPGDGKICTFDCIYCECGFNKDHRPSSPRPSREEVSGALEQQLLKMQAEGELPDVLTFAGNGEPTAHPDFPAIIDDTIALRNRLCPNAKVSVLSNATRAALPEVKEALLKVDNNILKLDSAFDATVQLMNNPQQADYTVERTVREMERFEGRMILQTMFLRGRVGECSIDNTTEQEVEAWLKIVERIRPQQVMVYTIDRDTPLETLSKVSVEELRRIAERVEALGIECSVAG